MGLKEDLKLTASERALMAALTVGTDVSIDTLFDALYGPSQPDARMPFTPARKQNYIGSHISRINKKLADALIKPGVARYTYRLETK